MTRSQRSAATFLTPVVPRVIEEVLNEDRTVEKETFKQLPQNFCERRFSLSKILKKRKSKQAAKKSAQLAPTNFVLDSTRSVLQKNIRRNVYSSTPTHVDMPLELFRQTFNTTTCNTYTPLRKLPNCVEGTALRMTEEQFIKMYGENEEFRKYKNNTVTVSIKFPITFYFSYQNIGSKYHSRFKWFSIPLVCTDEKKNVLPTYNYRKINASIAALQRKRRMENKRSK
ncbi:hypothetical protein AKO1_004472 [Acrasis kona]|uniref:Uncharacterized protein n=1 Tax=Acrasis kona TaxID=1008807 RepID=A0AAW2YWG4_9EUKA